MLSTSELNGMRDAIESLFPDTCTLLTPSQSSDGAGGFTTTWGTASANVACRLDTREGRETLFNGSVRPFNTFILSLPYDTVITEAYRVRVGSTLYNVTDVNNNVSWNVVKRVQLEEVSP
jgi:SPP1 family predicted phage head-tail adaptor